MSEAVLLTGAENQFHELYARFALSSFARADQFDRLITDALRQLSDFPSSAPEFIHPFRRLALPRFFLAVYYVIEGRRVFVHALLDSRLPQSAVRRHLDLPPD